MNAKKLEIREIIIAIVTGRESTKYGSRQIVNILYGVAEVLERRANKTSRSQNVFSQDVELNPADKLLAQEVIWDLIVERILTPGADTSNFDLPWVRLHSEAESKLK